jgi:6-pyruvoyltetrahydropterin/6-carboxytetrahydropterin synthase
MFPNFKYIKYYEGTISRKAHLTQRIDYIEKIGQNDLIFGKCNNPNYHGHNYELIVNWWDRSRNWFWWMLRLADLIKEEVENLIIKNLNLDVDFKT